MDQILISKIIESGILIDLGFKPMQVNGFDFYSKKLLTPIYSKFSIEYKYLSWDVYDRFLFQENKSNDGHWALVDFEWIFENALTDEEQGKAIYSLDILRDL